MRKQSDLVGDTSQWGRTKKSKRPDPSLQTPADDKDICRMRVYV